jgi:ABC-type tungstate transport system permease subunit
MLRDKDDVNGPYRIIAGFKVAGEPLFFVHGKGEKH